MKLIKGMICIIVIFCLITLNQTKLKIRTKNNFSSTCSNINYIASTATLNSNCLNMNQISAPTSIGLWTCIVNNDGVLQFQTNGQYNNSCNSCTVSQDFWLVCKCKTMAGNFVPTQIDLNNGINNTNGVLECGANPSPFYGDNYY